MQKNPTLDNVVMILCKNTSRNNGKHFDYPYYIAQIEKREITIKRQWLQERNKKK